MKRLTLLLFILMSSCNNNNSNNDDDKLNENLNSHIKNFFKENEEYSTKYGKIIYVKNASDWAYGKRQWVHFSDDSLLIYVDTNGEISSINHKKRSSDKAPERIYTLKKEYTAIEKPTDIHNTEDYYVHEFVNLISGGKLASVILKKSSLSRNTSVEKRIKIAKFLINKLDVTDLDIYTSIDALKANESSSYYEKNPNALKGLIGRVEDGVFIDPSNYKRYPLK